MSLFQQGAFTIDPNTTPEELAKKREAIQNIMKGQQPGYAGAGWAKLAEGLVDNIAQGKYNKFEDQKRSDAQAQYDALMGGVSPDADMQPHQAFSFFGGQPQGDTASTQYDQAGMSEPQSIANDTMAALGRPQAQYEGGQTYQPGSLSRDDVVNGLVQRGLPQHAAQGIAMNINDESGFNPAAVGDNGNALGLAQWNGPRMDALKQFAAQQGKPATDPNVQMDFLTQELQGPESGAMQAIMSTKSPGEAAAAFLNKYERPAEQNRTRREAAYLGGGQQYAQAAQSGPSTAALMEAANNPWLDAGSRATAQQMLAQRQKQSDPLYQMQLQQEQMGLQKGQLELQQMQQPKQGYRVLNAQQAQAMGLDPSKPYQVGPDGKVSQIGGGGVNVTVGGDNSPGLGKLSSDYGYVLDPATGKPVIDPQTGLPKAAAIPGSPAAQNAASLGDKQAEKDAMTARSSSIVTQDIDRALDQSNGFGTTGFLGGLSNGIGGTNAYDLRSTLQTIKGNIGFDRLQQMRDASPTGGALGQVSEQEMSTLQAVLGNLDQNQSKEQLQRNLERLKQVYSGIMKKASAYPNASQFGFGGDDTGGDGWQVIDGVKVRVKQ